MQIKRVRNPHTHTQGERGRGEGRKGREPEQERFYKPVSRIHGITAIKAYIRQWRSDS